MRRWWILIPVLLLCATCPAFAGPAGDASAKPGLMDIDPAAIIVSIAVFLVLLLVLTKFAWKPILTGLKQREEVIRKAVDDAQAASEKALATMKQYESRLAQAGDEARAILEEGKRDALALKASIEAEAKQSVEATTQRAVREIDQARLAAWDGLVRDAARLATETASRIIAKQLDAAGHAQLVEQVVGQIQSARSARSS